MNPTRWQEIERVYHAALEHPPAERGEFLAEACKNDSKLRVEVESLLAQNSSRTGALDRPPWVAMEQFTAAAATVMVMSRGARLGPYKIEGPLGKGGMGEVYRARDTKLKREVAIKILPDEFSRDPDRVSRFQREAEVLASLNHPNIAAIHSLEEADGARFLVLELVPGDTLAERIMRGPIPVNEALTIAKQICEALEAAHEKGVIHRDLKPANVKITPDGVIKVLDFGLAKVVAGESVPDLTQLPALSGTAEGVILGTAAYMSPEQARGKPVDKRTDIWAFGCVQYEMLTGRHAFAGNTVSDTIAAVLGREPIWDALPESTPASIQRLLHRCLEKDSKRRLHDVADARIELEDALSAPVSPRTVATRERRIRGSRVGTLVLGTITTILLIAVILRLVVLNRPVAFPAPSLSLGDVTLTPLTTDPGYEGEPTFSPDGETIAYTSDRTGNFEIFLKQVSGGADINLTNNVSEDVQPAFSPDGRQSAFISTRAGSSDLLFSGPNVPPKGGDIWVMPTLGGNARKIAESGNFPSWSPDGSEIIYVRGPWFGPKIYRIASTGGEPREIPLQFKRGFIPAHLLYPSYSSDGRWILFATPDDFYVVSREGGEPIAIGQGRNPVWGAESRTIIYSNAAVGKNLSLWQVPFDTAKGRVSGDPQPLTIGRGSDVQPAITRDGKRVALNAMNISTFIEVQPFDAEAGRTIGTPEPLTRSKDLIYFFDISPEGRSALFESQHANSTIWRANPESPLIQLTADPNFDDTNPRWSADGRTIAFSRKHVGELQAAYSLWLMSSDGANPRQVVERMGLNGLFTWMPDGHGLIHVGADRQLYFLDIAGKTERKLTNEPGVMPVVTISRDGSWVIYQCVVAGTVDLHAVPIGGGDVRTVVATPAQDYHPFVSPSGNWLYYYPDHKDLYRVPGPNQNWRTAAPEKVTNFTLSAYRFLEDPKVSQNGHYLAYSRGQATGDLWLMSLGK